MTKKNKRTDWFWAHRRNASLNHLSFIMHGMSGKGWMPAVNFWFTNQIIIGVPGKGGYIFYDRNQMSSKDKYGDVQKSIDSNPNFVVNFRRRTDEIFGAVFFKCLDIDENNLPLLSKEELHVLYGNFIQAVMACPLITVQLWGIEACFDENYRIMKFLRSRLKKIQKENELQYYREMISVNTGETVVFTEQKNFYQVASEIHKNQKLRRLFQSAKLKMISAKLRLYKYENALFEKHIRKFEWINTEYVSGGWSREKWVDLFKRALKSEITPEEKLNGILEDFKKLNRERKRAINELAPPKDVMHAIDSLAELIAQRDWTKGYFTKTLLSYHTLLDEIARRIGVKREDLFNYSYRELEDYFVKNKTITKKELENRKKNGYAIVIKDSVFSLTSGKNNIDRVIAREKISEPFKKYGNISTFRGLAASRGRIRGIARVLEDASGISDFKDGEIIVTYMTTIEFTPVFRKAAAVITDEGGMSCHAAIVSREFKIPCIVGTKIATRVLKTGDEIEVDADNGTIKILNK